mmetsp:Transcript_122541/g.261501  ORF Transcript_122541/g.261501 Transcript_122541/m.261501 type:complete len:347 (-) Transcript_122541:30-1070(-)
MGNAPIATFKADVDSPTDPGTKSVVSDPFPENITFEAMWENIKDWFKHPQMLPVEALAVKRVETVEHSANDFTTKVIMNGQILDKYGMGKGDGTDVVAHNYHVTFDLEKKEIVNRCKKSNCWLGEEDGDDKTYILCLTRFFKSEPPIQYDFVCTSYMEEPPRRLSGPEAIQLTFGVTDPIAQRLATTKVPTIPDVPSPGGGGQSIVTADFREHSSYDSFFPALVGVIKGGLKDRAPPGSEAQLIEMSATKFRLEYKDQLSGVTVMTMVEHDQDKGDISIIATVEDKVLTESHRKIHREPLVYEAWNVNTEGERYAGHQLSYLLQMELNAALTKASSWLSTFSMGLL